MSDSPCDLRQPPPAISLRPERREDEPFLFEVYASTREEELNQTGWDLATRRAFLDLQFQAMRRGYRSMFPRGEFTIILLAGQPVGRQVMNRSETEIRLVDVALLPQHRGQGVGTRLLQDLLAEASSTDKTVCLHVLKGSRSARLYERLGFRRVGADGIYDRMEWNMVASGSSPRL